MIFISKTPVYTAISRHPNPVIPRLDRGISIITGKIPWSSHGMTKYGIKLLVSLCLRGFITSFANKLIKLSNKIRQMGFPKLFLDEQTNRFGKKSTNELKDSDFFHKISVIVFLQNKRRRK